MYVREARYRKIKLKVLLIQDFYILKIDSFLLSYRPERTADIELVE